MPNTPGTEFYSALSLHPETSEQIAHLVGEYLDQSCRSTEDHGINPYVLLAVNPPDAQAQERIYATVRTLTKPEGFVGVVSGDLISNLGDRASTPAMALLASNRSFLRPFVVHGQDWSSTVEEISEHSHGNDVVVVLTNSQTTLLHDITKALSLLSQQLTVVGAQLATGQLQNFVFQIDDALFEGGALALLIDGSRVKVHSIDPSQRLSPTYIVTKSHKNLLQSLGSSTPLDQLFREQGDLSQASLFMDEIRHSVELCIDSQATTRHLKIRSVDSELGSLLFSDLLNVGEEAHFVLRNLETLREASIKIAQEIKNAKPTPLALLLLGPLGHPSTIPRPYLLQIPTQTLGEHLPKLAFWGISTLGTMICLNGHSNYDDERTVVLALTN